MSESKEKSEPESKPVISFPALSIEAQFTEPRDVFQNALREFTEKYGTEADSVVIARSDVEFIKRSKQWNQTQADAKSPDGTIYGLKPLIDERNQVAGVSILLRIGDLDRYTGTTA